MFWKYFSTSSKETESTDSYVQSLEKRIQEYEARISELENEAASKQQRLDKLSDDLESLNLELLYKNSSLINLTDFIRKISSEAEVAIQSLTETQDIDLSLIQEERKDITLHFNDGTVKKLKECPDEELLQIALDLSDDLVTVVNTEDLYNKESLTGTIPQDKVQSDSEVLEKEDFNE